jgi:hypothetical protein
MRGTVSFKYSSECFFSFFLSSLLPSFFRHLSIVERAFPVLVRKPRLVVLGRRHSHNPLELPRNLRFWTNALFTLASWAQRPGFCAF